MTTDTFSFRALDKRHLIRSMPPRIAILGGLVAAADVLFYDQRGSGLALFIFTALLGFGVVLAKAADKPRSTVRLIESACIATAAIVPLFETVTGLSVCIAMLGLAIAAIWPSDRTRGTLTLWFMSIAMLFIGMLYRLPVDLVKYRNALLNLRKRAVPYASLLVWVMPVAFTLGFLVLFAEANPLIEELVSLIDLQALLDMLDMARIVFWSFMAFVLWPFLKPQLPPVMKKFLGWMWQTKANVDTAQLPANVSPVFGPAAILRSLILFNLLFGLQTVLDAAYLWGGVSLPEGMSYAEYAHRGAYPLIVTALLAAAFVLLALRQNSESARSKPIRLLVYAWVAQNIMLVISSILRLDLYIETYSLTHMRVAAFIWMGLVAIGLALIIVRIARGKSNAWLVRRNLAVAGLVLYACSFINFTAVIADWNVTHSAEMGGNGQSLDVYYLKRLGPHAIPAAERFLASGKYRDTNSRVNLPSQVRYWRNELERDVQDLHTWTFRDWRLLRKLQAQGNGNPHDVIIGP